MRQDAIEQFEIKPAKGLTEGVTLSEEKTNVEVLFFCKEHKECRLLVYRDQQLLKKIKMFPRTEAGAPDLFGVRLCNTYTKFVKCFLKKQLCHKRLYLFNLVHFHMNNLFFAYFFSVCQY